MRKKGRAKIALPLHNLIAKTIVNGIADIVADVVRVTIVVVVGIGIGVSISIGVIVGITISIAIAIAITYAMSTWLTRTTTTILAMTCGRLADGLTAMPTIALTTVLSITSMPARTILWLWLTLTMTATVIAAFAIAWVTSRLTSRLTNRLALAHTRRTSERCATKGKAIHCQPH